MKALVFSDSHGKLDNLIQVLKQHSDYEAIFHLGDVESDESRLRNMTPYPIYMVRGNCDYYSKCQERLTVDWHGKHIVMCHGHRYLGYGGDLTSLRYLGEQEKADVVMFGHTHVPLLEKVGERIYLNPGSISRPRQKNKIPTYTIMHMDESGNLSFDMCEFSK